MSKLNKMKISSIAPLICILLVVVSTHANGDATGVSGEQTYERNNPLNLTRDKVFYPYIGLVYDIYQSEHEVKNVLVPIFGYPRDYSFNRPSVYPPIYFNLHEKGENLGQYVLINKTLHKINDGRNSVADYVTQESQFFTYHEVYIATSDGIYVYDTITRAVQKYGSLTEDIVAIDKVSGEDEFYILTTDNRIYKVTENGNVKTPVEGIEYAKDFVRDFNGDIYFIGDDNKPQVLPKGATVPHKFKEFHFDIVNSILVRPFFISSRDALKDGHGIFYIVDGVPYGLNGNQSLPISYTSIMPGLSSFSAELSFMHYYALNGKVYVHNLLDHPEPSNETVNKQASRKKVTSDNVVAFNRNVKADYESFKKL